MRVYVLGTCDTKGEELRFIADVIKAAGLPVKLVDLSTTGRISGADVPPLEIALVLLGIALTCALVTWLAARIYRVGLLMYGKRPTMRELVRWVRYAG